MLPSARISRRSPETAASARKVLSLLFLGAALAGAQDYGSHTLPADLADPAAKVQALLIKDPAVPTKPLSYCEGPAVDAEGNVFFTEQNPNRILKVTPQGTGSVFAAGTSGSNGMEFDPQSRLVVCQKGVIAVYDKAGVRSTLAVTGPNVDFKNINDLTIGSSGAMYFTNWDGNEIYFRAADGKTTRFTGFKVSNGIEWMEERKRLFLSQDGTDSVYRYDVAEDGALGNPVRFAAVAEPDGMTLDERGNLYVASWNDGKIMAFDSTGKSLGAITVKSAVPGDANPNGNTSNCVFGGPDNKTLYITGDGGAYRIQLKVAGRKRPGTTGLSSRRGRLGAVPVSGRAETYSLTGRRVDPAAPVSLMPRTSRPAR